MVEQQTGGVATELVELQNPAGVSPARIDRIVLTGFMGAGKTTVGNLLGERLGWRFVDVDAQIEGTAGSSIAELFAERGEPWFRQLEHETIQQLLEADCLVLALGGGAIEDERTRSLLLSLPRTQLIHLEASLETILDRCRGTEDLRPILQDSANLEGRYLKRLPLYRQAHLTLAVDSIHPGAAVEAILNHLGIPQAR